MLELDPGYRYEIWVRKKMTGGVARIVYGWSKSPRAETLRKNIAADPEVSDMMVFDRRCCGICIRGGSDIFDFSCPLEQIAGVAADFEF